jgi:hypothetical protein
MNLKKTSTLTFFLAIQIFTINSFTFAELKNNVADMFGNGNGFYGPVFFTQRYHINANKKLDIELGFDLNRRTNPEIMSWQNKQEEKAPKNTNKGLSFHKMSKKIEDAHIAKTSLTPFNSNF